ncbi:MAG: hypothetical protein A3F90_03175 [Deltaproteobacteria bacterium RIFCSPLOWO2_12_FULL_60_19]|nr:MAG: hypothetical protein A3F90_03175 [Deltaproteobacteria bacterium RIFCSPLOWO2_12_FULL_60_19]
MNGNILTRSFLLVFAGLWLWGGAIAPQPGASGAVNYKLVPNLEAMKDSSPTPEFALPLLSEGRAAPKSSLWQRVRRWWKPASVDGAEKKVALTDFRGKLVMLNFWASWCVPCREEMPQMERLYQEYKARGFVIVAVNVKDSRDDALAFVRELKFTYPALFDPEGEIGLLYGAWGLPTTYLIGPKGEGLARMWGPAKWDGAGAKQLIKDLLDGKR